MNNENVILIFLFLLAGCGAESNSDGDNNVSKGILNAEAKTNLPAGQTLKKIGEARVDALTARALEWMNEHPRKHEPRLCKIVFQIDQPVRASEHLEPLYVFMDKNDSKMAVRLWFKTNGYVAEAGPAHLSNANSLDRAYSASDLISPKQVLAIAARGYPDTLFTRIECVNIEDLAIWLFVTTNAKEYSMDAFSGQWKD